MKKGKAYASYKVKHNPKANGRGRSARKKH